MVTGTIGVVIDLFNDGSLKNVKEVYGVVHSLRHLQDCLAYHFFRSSLCRMLRLFATENEHFTKQNGNVQNKMSPILFLNH